MLNGKVIFTVSNVGIGIDTLLLLFFLNYIDYNCFAMVTMMQDTTHHDLI